MPIHPDLTAYRAVDAEGGTHTKQDVESGWAAGFDYALEAALKAVAKPDALMAELLEALKMVRALISEGAQEGFRPLVGDWAERLYHSQQATSALVAKAEGSALASSEATPEQTPTGA